MGWAHDVTMSCELGGRAATDLREESCEAGRRLIGELIQHRIDHTHGEWRWPMPDRDVEFEGEVVQRQWQMARCCGLKVRYGVVVRRCDNYVRLTQQQAAAKAHSEHVDVYCSWCAYDLERDRATVRRMAVP